jgi:hypothetical protein
MVATRARISTTAAKLILFIESTSPYQRSVSFVTPITLDHKTGKTQHIY